MLPDDMFKLGAEPHQFGDARDAIDAVSRFEEHTAEYWNYAITHVDEADPDNFACVVEVTERNGSPDRFYLQPEEA